MRGEPIELLTPARGLILNQPAQRVPLDGLLDGQNMFLDIDGLFKPRWGYRSFDALANLNIGPIIGIFWWRDSDGDNEYIAASPTAIAVIIAGVWTQVNLLPLTGSIFDPARFVAYFQNDIINVVMANNHDPLQQWATGQTNSLPLTPIIPASGTNAYVGTTDPTFVTYPVDTQVFFTVPNANTGAATLALNGLAAQPINKLVNGVFVALTGGELVPGTVYNVSYNGTVFGIGTNLVAPIARDIATIAGRLIAINITTIDPVTMIPTIDTQLVVWTTTFDFTVWPALAFNELTDSDDPLVAVRALGSFAAVIYGRESAWLVQAIPGAQDPSAFQFTPIQGVNVGPCSSAAVVIAEGLHYFLSTDFSVWACDGSSTWHISDAIDPLLNGDFNSEYQTMVHGIYYPQLRQIWWWYPSLTDNQPGPTRAIIYSLIRNVFEPGQVFLEMLRASAPISEANGAFSNALGSDSGYVYDFNPTINGDGQTNQSISYYFVPGLISAGSKKDLIPESIDIFLKPSGATGLFATELAQVELFGMPFPQAPPLAYTIIPFDLSDPRTYQLPQFFPVGVPGSPTGIYLTYQRYFRMQFQGTTIQRGFAFAGGTLFVNSQDRPSKNANQAPT